MATAVAAIRTRASALAEFHQRPDRTARTVNQSLGEIMAAYAAALRTCVAAYQKQYVASQEIVRREKKAGIPQETSARSKMTEQHRATIRQIWRDTGYDRCERKSSATHLAVERVERSLIKFPGRCQISAFARLCALWRSSPELTDRYDLDFLQGAVRDLSAALGLPDPTVCTKHRNPETQWRARWLRLAEVAEAIAAAAKAAIH